MGRTLCKFPIGWNSPFNWDLRILNIFYFTSIKQKAQRTYKRVLEGDDVLRGGENRSTRGKTTDFGRPLSCHIPTPGFDPGDTGVTVYLDPLGSLTPGGQDTPGYLDAHPGYLDPRRQNIPYLISWKSFRTSLFPKPVMYWFMFGMIIDNGKTFYAVPSLSRYMTSRSRSLTLIFYVKVFVKVFRTSWFPNPVMFSVHVWYNDIYLSNI